MSTFDANLKYIKKCTEMRCKMFFRILKKELKRKKGINLILFLFITLATIFVASSVNNIFVVSNATKYCMEKGNVADQYIYSYGDDSIKKLDDWLNGEGKQYIKDYGKDESVLISNENIKSFAGKQGGDYEIVNSVILQKQWKKYMSIYDQNQNTTEIKDGEIAMQKKDMNSNNLKVGDSLVLQFGDYKKEFKVAQPIKDPAFGGDFIGMSRYFISDEDYKEIADNASFKIYSYNINVTDSKFAQKLDNADIFYVVSLGKSVFEFTYVMSMVTSGILIVIGICLIIIAFLILRFTIMVTLQEDYKEIGIMKAIGIKNTGIKSLYMIKYFVISIGATVIGCALSFPMSAVTLKVVMSNMMMEGGSAHFIINIGCSILVLLIVLMFCYLITNKVKKYSAIEAIRSGETGERYKKKSVLSLHKFKRMRTPFFMAVNDIFSNVRRYMVLLLTFAMGAALITLSLNVITSINSDEMLTNFMLNLDSDFYMNSDCIANTSGQEITAVNIKNRMDNIESEFKAKGYDVSINTMMTSTFAFYNNNKDELYRYMTVQPINSDGSYVKLIDGSIPMLENEIAMSEMAMKEIGVKVGDTVHMIVNGKDDKMIIVGSYQNFMQTGRTAMISENFDSSNVNGSGSWFVQGKIKNKTQKIDWIQEFKDNMTDYQFYTDDEILALQLGNSISQLQFIKGAILALICGINILVTILMMKIFILGEKGQIAMLRSIGYSISEVRKWQVIRISIILILGVILGTILSIPLNNVLIRPIFGMMGATHMKIQTNPLEAYCIYPIILLAVVIISAYISSASVKKLNLMEINNME